jgi:TRAP-type uncharacterized transport system fused permease subunit
VFGVALGVSTNFIFLFVLFGALLGEGRRRQATSSRSRSRCSASSAADPPRPASSRRHDGMISGSSVANVVTTGTFTIPLMKRVGYPAVKAGRDRVRAGVNGQLMPPVMGAAAFLMAEYVGVTYAEICKAALPARDPHYGALFYVVDLEP